MVIKLPTADDMGRVQQQGNVRPIVQTDNSMAGKALQGVGAQVQRAGYYMQREQEAERKQQEQNDLLIQKSVFATNFLSKIDEATKEFESDTDYATQPARFVKRMSVQLPELLSQISDPTERELTRQATYQSVIRYKEKIQADALAKKRDISVASLDNALAIAPSLYESQGESALAPVIANIDANVQAGNISMRDGEARKRGLFEQKEEMDLMKMPARERLARLSGQPIAMPVTTGNDVLDEDIQIATMDSDISSEFLMRTAMLESSGGKNNYNPKSGAAGTFQLMPETAKEYGVTNPYDNLQSSVATVKLTERNKATMETLLDRPVENAELYLSIQQGAGGAAGLLKNPEMNVVEALKTYASEYRSGKKDPKKAVLQNGGRLDMTAGEFASKWINKYNGMGDASEMSYLSPQKREQILMQTQREIEQEEKLIAEQAEQAALFETVGNAIRGSGYINPKDTKQMKTFDAVYNQQVLDNPDLTIEDKATGTAEIVKNVGIIPNSLKGRAQQVFRLSENPEEIAQYADIFARVEEESPQVLNDLPNETRIMVSYINEGRRAGIDLTDRVMSMRSAMLPENAPMVEKRKELLKGDSVKKIINTNAQNLFDGWIPFTGQEIDTETGINQLVVNDYKTAFEQSYMMTEDVDAANAYASSVVKTQYAPSMFADGGIMKYPPEMYYAIPNDDGAWMQKYLLDDVNEFYGNQKTPIAEKDAVNREIDFIQSKLPTTFNPTEKKLLEEKITSLQKSIPEGTPLTDNQVRIMSDSRTLREARATGKPSYAVIVTTYPNGYPKVETLKARFVPDMQKRLQERIAEQEAANKQNQSVRDLRTSVKTGAIQ